MSKIDKVMCILLVGFCINFCFGIFYVWSVFNKVLVIDFGWSVVDVFFFYVIVIIVFFVCFLVVGIL